MNREYELLAKDTERWHRRQMSRMIAVGIALLALAFFAMTIAGQEPVTLVYIEKPKSPWTYLGEVATPLPKKDLYYRAYRYRHGRGEAWLKWVFRSQPPATGKLKALRKAAYHLQYATVDCDAKRITLESSSLHDKRGNTIYFPYAFTMNTFGQPVYPGTIGEMLWSKFCTD